MMRILTPEQIGEWSAVLERAVQHDFYHLPAYHAMAEQRGEGEARLFVQEEGGYTIALPLLLRPLSGIAGAAVGTERWRDATSVYGYAGPLASHARVPEQIAGNFQSALKDALIEQGVVTAFSRLHP